MRRLPMLAALAALGACGFDSSGLAAGGDVTDDTTADFMRPGATFDQTEVADPGLISPAAYVTGAALAKGANSELFTDPATADWNTLDASTPAKVALSAPLGDFGNGAPAGLGITQADNFTVWLAGEVWLEAGTHTFLLSADDNGFVDLAPPGGAFTRVVHAQWFSGAATGTFTASADGWYPIHIAISEGSGAASFLLQHQPPGATAMAPFEADRLRVAAGAQRGLIADAFDDFYLVRPVGRSLLTAPLLDQTMGTSAPADTGITAASTYSFHWTAQVLVDVAGDYAFLVDSVAGHRLRVDGALLSDELTGHPQTDTTSMVHLDLGWHDVVMDYTEVQGSAHVRLNVASGPELTGAPFPAARVRPVVPRADRAAGAADETDLLFAANGTIDYTLAPTIPAGAAVGSVEVEYTLNDQHDGDVEIAAIAPDGTRVIMHPSGSVDRAGTITEWHTLHDFDGTSAHGAWKVEMVDKGGRSGGNSRDAAITVHYLGGHAPIATTAAYESAPRDLGVDSQIASVTYVAAAPAGTSVIVRLRTGASADDLMANPWSDPIKNGDPPIVGAGQLVQYRVELTSDGDHSPTFDSIELVYRAATGGS